MLTFEEMMMTWFGPVPIGRPVKPKWHVERRWLVRMLVEATYEHGVSLRVDRYTKAWVWKIQRWGRARGLSAATINHVTHSAPMAMVRDHEAEGLLPEGTHAMLLARLKPARRLRMPRVPRERALTIEERGIVLEAARDDDLCVLFNVLFLTGLRIGEACALEQRSVDWKRRFCTVVHTREYEELGETKTENSERIVRLPRAGVAALAPYRISGSPAAPLIRTPKGKHADQHNFRRRHWNAVVAKAGFPELTPHHARHTFATICLERGVKPAPLAAYLGHTVDVLLERYGHVLGDFDIDDAVHAPGLGEVRTVGGRDVADLGF